MGSLKSTNQTHNLGPLCPVVGQSPMVWLKNLPRSPNPWQGKSPHHINSTHDFVEQVKHINLAPGECLSSYAVSALFTSVPVHPTLKVIKDLLEKDPTLKERTALTVEDITLLLEVCLKIMYFSFQGQFYEWVEGATMGSPVSPIVANLYMKYFEQKALSTAPHPLDSGTGMWMTHFSSKRKSINRTSYNTSTVLTLPFSLQWRTTRRMGPFPSGTPLLNQRLMENCLPLCIGNPPTLTNTYSGTITIASQPSFGLSTPSPIELKHYEAILSYSTKRRPTSAMH